MSDLEGGATASSTERSRSRQFVARHLVALIVFVAAIVFIAENTGRVRLRVIGPLVTLALWEALVATFIAGIVVTLLVQRRRRTASR